MKQFGRFLLVGASNFVVSFAVFYLFYEHWRLSGPLFGVLGEVGEGLSALLARVGAGSADATLANLLGYSVGVFNSFLWNRRWTFRMTHAGSGQLRRFLLLNLACLVSSSSALFLLVDRLDWPYRPTWLITMGLITLLNFALSKHWVFRRSGA